MTLHGGTHYTSKAIQPIQVMKANMTHEKYKGFLEGNVLKYLMRYEDKGTPLKDLDKCKDYLEALIEAVEEEKQDETSCPEHLRKKLTFSL